MAIKECKECGKDVSTKAKKCPHCGAPVKRGGILKWLGIIFVGLVVLSTLGRMGDSNKGKDASKQSSSSPKKQVESKTAKPKLTAEEIKKAKCEKKAGPKPTQSEWDAKVRCVDNFMQEYLKDPGTRDKMCAARRKGKWIGGYPILGYDIHPNGGRLIVNKSEAEQVVEIFKLYLQHQSLLSVVKELNARGLSTKSWITRNGKQRRGKPFTKTNLHSLLKNITYVGKVAHQGHIYQGEQ